jgi:hypothetical protein
MEATHELLHLNKQSLLHWKFMDIPTRFISIIIFCYRAFEYDNCGIFRHLRWMQNLQQSMWDHEILYADRSWEDEQLLGRLLLLETENMNTAGSWNLKFIFHLMETTDELLHLDKWSFVQWKITDMPTSFIWSSIFFDRAFEYGGVSKFWGYVPKNSGPLCVEFCNFVHCHTFVKCSVLLLLNLIHLYDL